MKQAGQRRGNRKLNPKNWNLLESPAHWTQWTLYSPPKLLDRQAQSQHPHRSSGLVSFWLSCICQSWVSVFRRGPASGADAEPLLGCEGQRHTTQPVQATDVEPILDPGRARHKIFFTQFPFCVRNRVAFDSAQFVVLFNFI